MLLNKCAQCGADLGSNSVGGMCPRCLVRILRRSADGLETPPESGAGHDAGKSAGIPRPLLFGDYELLEEVARGGMGVVWRARQVGANRVVALKMILAGRFANASEVKRFRAEAEAAAHLDHPSIIPIYDVGEHEDQCYFTMKLIEGRSLARAIQEGLCFKTHCAAHGQPAILAVVLHRCCATAALLIAKVARAVHYAHQRGVLHRDLTPGNILLDAAGEPHVTDFGLAKRLDTDFQLPTLNAQLTLSGTVLGTPSYLAPEQAAGGSKYLTTAADIYSLGAILYELLTGRPPFQGPTALATLQAAQTQEPTRPRSLNPRLDPNLETICLKCLEKDPAHRYNSAASLADDLDRFVRHEPIRARPSTVGERVTKWAQRNPLRAGLTATLAAVSLLAFTGIFWQWQRAEQALGLSQEALWQANFDRAQARRTSRTLGQRVEALKAIRTAAAIRPTPELRNEAIAAMALTDLEDAGGWFPVPTNVSVAVVDARLEHIALSRRDGLVEIRNFQDGRLLATLTNGQVAVHVGFSDTGDILSVDDDARWRLWDWRKAQLLLERLVLRDDTSREFCALSRDGTLAAYPVSSTAVEWWELRSGRVLGRIDGLVQTSHRSLCFNPANDLLLVSAPGSIREVWRLADRTRLRTLRLGVGIEGLDWCSGEPLLAVGGQDRNLSVWDILADRLQTLGGHHREGVRPLFHPQQSLLASTAFDNILRLWDPVAAIPLLETAFGTPRGFSADGQGLLVENARGLGWLKVHTAPECRLFHAPLGVRDFVSRFSFSRDGRYLAGAAVNGAAFYVWEMAAGRRVAEQPLQDAKSLEFVGEDTLLTASRAGVLLWTNALPGLGWSPVGQTQVVSGKDWPIEGASLNRDLTQVAVRHNDVSEFFELPSGRPRGVLASHPMGDAGSFSRDGRWLAAGYWDNGGRRRSDFRVFSTDDGQPARIIPTGNSHAHFSPDGRWLLIADEKEYLQFAVAGTPTNWTQVRRFARDASGFEQGSAAFSADGQLLALQADQRIYRLVEAATGHELARLTPLPEAYHTGTAAFSPDGRWFVAASDIGLHVWDLALIRARLREMHLDWSGSPALPPPPH